MNIEQLIDEVIAREGDYSNHPDDRGGPTRWGITQAVARAHGYAGDMRGLPRSRASSIYRALYWDGPRLCDIAPLSPGIAAELFDTGVNMGAPVAAAFLQRALNALNRQQRDYRDLLLDRKIGPATIAALAAFLATRGTQGEAVLLKALEALQGERYIGLAEQRPANEAFLYGWMANRIG